MKLDDEIVELKEWDAVRVRADVAGTRPGRRSRDPRHRRARSSATIRAKTSRLA